jgi:DNA-binding NtrC family response regulator
MRFPGGIMTQAASSRPIALVVEADREERALVCTLLEEAEMQVIECDSAEAALAVIERKGEQMAMVLTDVGLAGRMDGVELAQNLDARHPEVAVVVISAEPSQRVDELPANVVYLASPWRPLDVLIAAERARLAA